MSETFHDFLKRIENDSERKKNKFYDEEIVHLNKKIFALEKIIDKLTAQSESSSTKTKLKLIKWDKDYVD